ncbi:hypothetical protein NUM3379_28440 [Kineococcus sp. NUM-3379]
MDAATWALVNASTRKLADQTAEALRIREIAQQIAARHRNTGLPQRAGHLFEVMHEASFNRNAIKKGSALRAPTTEWAAGGSQNAAADLHILDGQRLLAAAQAKLMGRATTTARSIANDRYDGMQRLIAVDQLKTVEDLLDRRLTLNPEEINYADYADARAHVTDTLHAGIVSSRPVTTTRAHKAAARGAVRSGSIAGLGKSIGIAAKAGTLPAALGRGSSPAAMAEAVIDITEAGIAFARGDLDSGDLAARCCQAALRTAITAARADHLDEERIEALEDEAATALATALLLAEAEHALGEQRNAHVTTTVSPLLDDALIAATTASPEEALKRLTEVARCFSGQPLFVTVDEFDAWMADPMTTLTMNPNWH